MHQPEQSYFPVEHSTQTHTVPNLLDQTNANAPVNPAVAYLLSLGSANSRKQVRSQLGRIAKLLNAGPWDQAPWHSLRRSHIQALLYALAEQGLSPTSRNSYLSAIKGVCREAWLAKQLSGDDFQAIREIKGPRGSRVAKGKALPPDDVDELLNADSQVSAKQTTPLIMLRNRAIIALLLTSGLRKSEAINIKTADLDLVDLAVQVIGKGDKGAKVFIHPAARCYLEQWLQARNGTFEYLFTPITRHGHIKNRKLSAAGVDYIVKQAALVVGVNAFAAHDTRRTFATRMFEAGVDPMKVRDAMRHSSITTTQVYNIQDERRLREAIESVTFI